MERNEWELVGDMNHERELAAAAVLEGKMYVMGGQEDEDNNLDSVEKYDAERDVWVELEDEGATLRVGRSGLTAAVV